MLIINIFSISKKENRPKIKLKLDEHDWAVEFIAFILLIAIIVLQFIFYGKVPGRIPVYFIQSINNRHHKEL
jgi:hypothetical protein